MSDSAGTPWAGRSFQHHASTDDDGSAPPALMDALARFRAGTVGETEVVSVLGESRLLVPLVARLDEAGLNVQGHTVEKSAELAIVTVTGPDGRAVMPAFSSVQTMRVWDPKARPVPAAAIRVALAAAGEQTDLVVLDPGSVTEFVIRRPAVWAIGQRRGWTPSYLDPEVLAAFEAVGDPRVTAVRLSAGDPDARLAGPELLVELTLTPALDRASLDDLLVSLQRRWAEDPVIAERVDSMGVRLS